MDEAPTSSSGTPQQQQVLQELQQAQKEFHKVMGLLQSALEQKQPNCTIPAEAPKDPFYRYNYYRVTQFGQFFGEHSNAQSTN